VKAVYLQEKARYLDYCQIRQVDIGVERKRFRVLDITATPRDAGVTRWYLPDSGTGQSLRLDGQPGVDIQARLTTG